VFLGFSVVGQEREDFQSLGNQPLVGQEVDFLQTDDVGELDDELLGVGGVGWALPGVWGGDVLQVLGWKSGVVAFKLS
jgi:hypothetical protein